MPAWLVSEGAVARTIIPAESKAKPMLQSTPADNLSLKGVTTIAMAATR